MITEKMQVALGRRLERRHTERRAGDVPHTSANISLIRRVLGYTPCVAFDKGLGRTVEHLRDAGHIVPTPL